MARTIDTTVTDDLSAVIRLMETGPKICQKYIEHPALFQGKKFDLRYIVLVRSMNPLEIFLSDVFWVCTSSSLCKFLILAKPPRKCNSSYFSNLQDLFDIGLCAICYYVTCVSFISSYFQKIKLAYCNLRLEPLTALKISFN